MVSLNFYSVFFSYILSLLTGGQINPSKSETKPHIVVIMTDDMGWNDVGFHGSNEIPTPNIDALAYSGIILNRHYTMPTCTPSRAAFLTGRHPIRMGLQGLPISMAEPRGIPLREKLLPEYLRELGYVTRLVGKWHLGYYTEKHTPTRRGFDSFVGYYGGYVRYFDHTVTKNKHTGIDFHLDTSEKVEPYDNNEYLTDFIADQSEKIIKNHEKQKPLYLQISHLAAHASENADPIEVHNLTEVNNTLGYISDLNRRRYAGIITAMDESVGKVVKALSEANMLEKSIIIFTSDNGAPTAVAPFKNYGSNYPFRGIKATLLEGGVRVPSFIFSPLLKINSRVSEDFIHITDWFPTIYKLAGGDPSILKDIDGIDQWSTLSEGQRSKRDSIFLNIDEKINPEAAIKGKYKLIRGIHAYADYYGQNGNDYSPNYNIKKLLSSLSGIAIKNLPNHSMPKEGQIINLRKKATIRCQLKTNYPKCTNTCLFDIIQDPCETTDISDKNPKILSSISQFIDGYRGILMNQTNTYVDSAGYPENYNGYWMPWMNNEYTPPKDRNMSIWSPTIFCEGYPVGDPRNCL